MYDMCMTEYYSVKAPNLTVVMIVMTVVIILIRASIPKNLHAFKSQQFAGDC